MALVNIEAEMAGAIWKVEVKEGDSVSEEDVLMIMESMKMEIPICAPEGGVIKAIKVKEGDVVSEGDLVVVLEV